MTFKWWEKTVEYSFVMELANKNKLFISPLAGNHEKGGDVVLGTSDLWVMIEFKKDLNAVGSELIKFSAGNYEKAKEELVKHDKHHHIVYGVSSTSDAGKPYLGLRFQTYFSQKHNDLVGLLASGKPIEEFNSYLKKFTDFKRESSSGSGGMAVEDYMMVAGVTKGGQVVECISMREFLIEHKLEPELELEFEVKKNREKSKGFER